MSQPLNRPGSKQPEKDVRLRDEREPLEDLEREIASLDLRSHRHGQARLVTFVGFVLGLAATAYSSLFPLVLSAPFLIAFVVAFVRHGRIQARRKELDHRRRLHLEILERKFDRRRQRPLPPEPPTPSDDVLPLERGESLFREEPQSQRLDAAALDDLQVLSGPRNLFSLLDASSTFFGANRLQRYLSDLLTRAEDIRERQSAVEELAGKEGALSRLLEAFLALRGRIGPETPRGLRAPLPFARRPWLEALAHLLGTLPWLLLLAAFFHSIFLPFIVMALVVNLALIGLFVKESNPARDRLIHLGSLLEGLLNAEETLSALRLDGDLWRDIEKSLREARPAAVRLKRLVSLLDLHSYGLIFEVINVLSLWELRFLPRAEAVLDRHREELERAAGALGETEALASLAAPLLEQEGFCMPRVLEEKSPRLEATSMGHPLIESRSVVRNPIQLGPGRNVRIVTGSNMTGKSTYLKSLGCNLVLAGAGGPVCAKEFQWTPLRLVTDINVRDSLDDGKSYFQVEVERVRDVVRTSEHTPLVLAIFDELFRGTNSEERLALSRSIIRHLRDRGILLIVATHDGGLARRVARDDEPGIRNFHFQETVVDARMVFDYRLREGQATTRNAIRVLEEMGYPRGITEEANAEVTGEPG